MPLTITTENGIAFVEANLDALDASNVQAFKSGMSPVIAEHAKVVLDLTHVRFVDSSGLGAILSSMRQLNGKGGDLKICSVSKSVRALFELVRFHRILDLLNTREEAVLAFGQ